MPMGTGLCKESRSRLSRRDGRHVSRALDSTTFLSQTRCPRWRISTSALTCHYPYSGRVVETNRERAVAAAIELLGTSGVRALTHRQVDERAGLPAGSTSNYFRTRAALFEGVLEAMMTGETPAVGAVMVPTESVEEFVDRLVDLYAFLAGPTLVRTAARMALMVEAGHNSELRPALGRGRATMVGLLRPAVAALGARDPDFATDAIAICFEGLFLHAIAQHASVDVRRHIELVVRACLT